MRSRLSAHHAHHARAPIVGLLVTALTSSCSEPAEPAEPADPATGSCDPNPKCNAVGDSTFVVGRLTDSQVQAFDSATTLTLEFGPQGGQHIFVGTQIETSELGEWDLSLELVDPETSLQGGYAFWSVRVCDCPTIYENLRIFVDLPQAKQYTLEAEATSPAGEELAIVPAVIRVAP